MSYWSYYHRLCEILPPAMSILFIARVCAQIYYIYFHPEDIQILEELLDEGWSIEAASAKYILLRSCEPVISLIGLACLLSIITRYAYKAFVSFMSTFNRRRLTGKNVPRFRKRDKVMFYGRKMIRKLARKRRMLFRFAKELSVKPTPKTRFSKVAVMANHHEVPLDAFCQDLNQALGVIGPTIFVNSQTAGQAVLDSTDPTENHNPMVLYQCDYNWTPRTLKCLQQADCILIVTLARLEPKVSEIEQKLMEYTQVIRGIKEIALLHMDADKPKDTVKWLDERPWCSSHHHIRCPQYNTNNNFESNDNDKDIEPEPKNKSKSNNINDFARLARRLTGTSIGLVLGGGGARGGAHIGMIRAILEAGIPIDMVGGVSIGAFMGALWCQENDIKIVTQLARNWCMTMTSLWHKILDLTYPVTAMFTGAAFNRTIYDLFGDRQIEDLWLPYFNVTTDITSSGLRVHRQGSLWRYVRSSMSLSGYLPPLCDPVDGHLLLDGGYVNNLPADIMKDVMGAKTILAVDVGSQDDTDLANYGDHLSGWWLLWNRWNPFGTRVRIPGLSEIQNRLAYVCCVNKLEEVKAGKYCTYLRPPVEEYSSLDFGKIDEVIQVGYKHGKSVINRRNNNIQEISGLKSSPTMKK